MPWSEQLHDRTGRTQDCRLRQWFPKVELRKAGMSVTLSVCMSCVSTCVYALDMCMCIT